MDSRRQARGPVDRQSLKTGLVSRTRGHCRSSLSAQRLKRGRRHVPVCESQYCELHNTKALVENGIQGKNDGNTKNGGTWCTSGCLLLEHFDTQRPRSFQRQKELHFDLWPTNSDSTGIFFILGRAQRVEDSSTLSEVAPNSSSDCSCTKQRLTNEHKVDGSLSCPKGDLKNALLCPGV